MSYNQNENLSSSTSRLDEVKKSLPLRQQTDKPVLKAKAALNGEAQNKFIIEPQGGSKNGYYGNGKAAVAASPTHHYFSSYMYMNGPNASNGVAITPAHILASSVANAKPSSNPYARPISATEVRYNRAPSNPSFNGNHRSTYRKDDVAMPTNSFLLPQSKDRDSSEGQAKVVVPQNATKKMTPAATTLVDGPPLLDDGQSECSAQGGQSPVNFRTVFQSEERRASGDMTQDLQNVKTTPRSQRKELENARTSVPLTSTRPSTPVPKKTSAIRSEKVTTSPMTQTLVLNKPPIPTPPPGAKIRNLSYTPTKPYSEIVANHLQTIQRLQNKVNSSATAHDSDVNNNHMPKQVKATQKEGKAQTIKKSHQHNMGSVSEMLKDGSLKKMPVTNTITGTVYYRKSSKGEAVIQKSVAKDIESDEDGEEEESRKLKCEPSFVRNPSVDDEDVIDEDCLDGLEDDDLGESDEDNSDGYSIRTGTSSASSQRSHQRTRSAIHGLACLSLNDKRRPVTARVHSGSVGRPSSNEEPHPNLMQSLFPNIPPTVNFVLDGQRVDLLPWELRKLLKWKMSPITPNVIKNCISRSGFRATKKNYDWIGYWGKHMKAQGFKAIREYQKVNHFPGSFQIGRKDRLWRNLSHMQVLHGRKDFNFIPQTFCLPCDLKQLKRVWEDGGNKLKWIIKPPASARGIGIKVIHKWNQIPKKRAVVVQRYLSRPYLINGSKFDLRLYVYVTSYDPLRIYLYDDGLTRFASSKYSSSMKSLSNKYMHLTNYSINKKNTEYQSNTDENICQGHKWGLKPLWGYLRKQGINTNPIWENIKDVIIKTIICSESCINSLIKGNVKRKYSVHELFGFDIMLDENLKPWVIEVNISPSLHSNSQLDLNIKGGMVKDMLNICGFVLPDKSDVTTSGVIEEDSRLHGSNNPLCMDHRLFPSVMPSDERAKHAYYCQRHMDTVVLQTILDVLTPSDVRILAETLDEDSRKGNFQRIFPAASSHKYMTYFEQPKYFNLLLDQWIQKYNRMDARGLAYIESLCSKNIHLQTQTDDPKHQWSPPKFTIPRDIRVTSAPLKPKHLPLVKKSNSQKSTMSSTSSLRSTATSCSSTDLSSQNSS